jgi:hypothetical protein
MLLGIGIASVSVSRYALDFNREFLDVDALDD